MITCSDCGNRRHDNFYSSRFATNLCQNCWSRRMDRPFVPLSTPPLTPAPAQPVATREELLASLQELQELSKQLESYLAPPPALPTGVALDRCTR